MFWSHKPIAVNGVSILMSRTKSGELAMIVEFVVRVDVATNIRMEIPRCFVSPRIGCMEHSELFHELRNSFQSSGGIGDMMRRSCFDVARPEQKARAHVVQAVDSSCGGELLIDIPPSKVASRIGPVCVIGERYGDFIPILDMRSSTDSENVPAKADLYVASYGDEYVPSVDPYPPAFMDRMGVETSKNILALTVNFAKTGDIVPGDRAGFWKKSAFGVDETEIFFV